MKQSVIAALVIIGGLAALWFAYSDPEKAQMSMRAFNARATIVGYQKSLQKELVQALDVDGPVKAIDVCNLAAPTLAAARSEKYGIEVGRTALKLRNQSNAPDEFEKRILEDFAAKIAKGVKPERIEHAEFVTDSDGKKVFRYMRPIIMKAKPCSMCHGTNITAEVTAAIAKHYPNDQAVGFKPGELRGAFTASQNID